MMQGKIKMAEHIAHPVHKVTALLCCSTFQTYIDIKWHLALMVRIPIYRCHDFEPMQIPKLYVATLCTASNTAAHDHTPDFPDCDFIMQFSLPFPLMAHHDSFISSIIAFSTQLNLHYPAFFQWAQPHHDQSNLPPGLLNMVSNPISAMCQNINATRKNHTITDAWPGTAKITIDRSHLGTRKWGRHGWAGSGSIVRDPPFSLHDTWPFVTIYIILSRAFTSLISDQMSPSTH